MQKSLCVCRKELAAGFARYALQNAACYFIGEDAEQTYQCEKQSSTVSICLLGALEIGYFGSQWSNTRMSFWWHKDFR